MEHWRVIRTPAPWRRTTPTEPCPTELRGSLLAMQCLARLDAVLGTGCHYCDNPRLYSPLPGGCPCRSVSSPGLRRRPSSVDEHNEIRAQLLRGETKIEHRPCQILSIR